MKKHLIKILLLLIVFQLRSQNNFCLSLNTNSAVTCGSIPKNIAYADLNNDGQLDYVTSLWGPNFHMTLSNGLGGYNNPIFFQHTQTFYSNVIIKLYDFSNDNNIDLTVSDTSTNDFQILLGDGTGLFTNTVNISCGPKPWKYAVTDFNSDSNLDMAIINRGSTAVKTFTNNGTASLTPVQTFTSSAIPSDILSFDFDNDGVKDILLTFENSTNLSIYKGAGNGQFNFANTYSLNLVPDLLKADDFNADGKMDIVSLSSNSVITLALGNGANGFLSQTSYTTGAFVYDFSSGDLNSDNVTDLAVIGGYQNDLFVFPGTSGGTFSQVIPFPILFTAMNCGFMAHFAVHLHDLNGDGKKDLIVGLDNCGQIQIVENCVIASGIDKHSNKMELLLFPNPASNFIAANVSGNYKIANCLGEIVQSGESIENESIEITDLPEGLYTLITENGSNIMKNIFVVRKSF